MSGSSRVGAKGAAHIKEHFVYARVFQKSPFELVSYIAFTCTK